MNKILKNSIVVLSLAVLTGCLHPILEKANLLFLFTNNHSRQAISAYSGGFRNSATSHLDQLAAEGVRLINNDRSITNPSRAVLLSEKSLKFGKNEIPSNYLKLYAKDFGIVANSTEDQSENFRRALETVRKSGAVQLIFEKGTYHFYAEKGLEKSFWISNHDRQPYHKISLPLIGLKNLTIQGNGSDFIFHGKGIPVLFMDCENITLDGVRIDYARPLHSEAKVLGFKGGKTLVSIDKEAFPYEIRDRKIFFLGENYPPQGIQGVIAFRKDSKNIVANTSDIPCGNGVSVMKDGTLALHRNFGKDGVAVGDTLTLRSYWRPHPACVIYRAKNTQLRDVTIHSSFGMALLAQRSENIRITGSGKASDKTSGVFPHPKSGRVHSSSADATHFSNVKGLVVVENSFFETMMDDAINVHSTCLDIAEIVESDTLRCRYRHHQAVGFELFTPGENLRFIAGRTLENGAVVKVKSVEQLSPTEVLIRLTEPVPAEIKVGDAVENADFQPEVIFRGNIVQNNRARGALFTTPKKVLVENNLFRNVAGSAILLAGDAQGWYESGACEDIIIRKNCFDNNLTSRFQFTNAIISIYPEVKDLSAQKKYYHRNVVIENNLFRSFDVPLVFAISTENLRFEKNKIYWNNDFKAWKQKPFQFRRCKDIIICDNEVAAVGETVLSQQKWTHKDCDLQMTEAETVRFE